MNKNSLANLGRNNKKNITPEDIRKIQAVSNSSIERAALLGISAHTYYKYCKLYGIPTKPPSKKQPLKLVKLRSSGKLVAENKTKNPFRLRRPLDLILQNKYTDIPSSHLKKLLIKAGLKEDKCELCGIEQKRECDGKTPLILKFLDENKQNYKIENLQIICFNCNFLYYDEWSLKKILERVERKKRKCEAVLNYEESNSTRTDNTIVSENKTTTSGSVGNGEENPEMFQSDRKVGEEAREESKETGFVDEID